MRVSLSIPTYQRSDCLKRLLESIISTTIPHGFEIRIFDNASSDSTHEVVRGLMAICQQISWWPSESNIGGGKNIIRCLRHSTDCDYVWLISDHMEFKSNVLSELSGYLSREQPDLVCLGLNGYVQSTTLPPLWKGRYELLTSRQKASLLFEMSNISALICKTSDIAPVLEDCERLVRFSFPHMGILDSFVKNRAIISRVTIPVEFQQSHVVRYDWVESGLLRLGEAVALHLKYAGGRKQLREMTKIQVFSRTAIKRVAERVADGHPLTQADEKRLIDFYGFRIFTIVILTINRLPPIIVRLILKRGIKYKTVSVEAFD
jgi:glycosyltransferase involved in cell wall biosynthesis